MKKLILFTVILVGLYSCKNDKKTEEQNNQQEVSVDDVKDKIQVVVQLNGEFLHTKEASILKTAKTIYAVKENDKLNELIKKSDSLKKNEFDMIPVLVKGVIEKNNTTSNWDEMVDIIDILKVSEPKKDDKIITISK